MIKNKPIRYFIIFLLIVGVIALVTMPGRNEFYEYLIKKGKGNSVCAREGTRYTSYRFISVHFVRYCGTNRHTDKYIGLFGTFIKVKNSESN